MNTDYAIRLARHEDLSALAAIELAAAQIFLAEGFEAGLLEKTVPSEELATAVSENRLWVGTHQEHCVGFALAAERTDECWLEEVSVHPDHGQRGLGRALVEAVLAWAARRGDGTLWLSTFRDIAWNGPFYLKLGFREHPMDQCSPATRQVVAQETARGLPAERRVVLRCDRFVRS